MRALVWFRADLRIADNTALFHACKEADNGVVAVFALCPKQWASHDWGMAKVDFVLRNLEQLSAALAKLNIPLKLIDAGSFDSIPAKLLKVARAHHCDALYFNREHEVNELARDGDVQHCFDKAGIPVRSFVDQTILDVAEIETGAGGWYTVFTPFKRKWCATLEEQGPPPIWSTPRRQPKLDIISDPVPNHVGGFEGQSHADSWPAGEKEASKRLRRFVTKRIEGYKQNRDIPAVDGTSTLSPYLSSGVISPRQCLEEAVAANNGQVDSGDAGIATWISELIWREFYRHVMIGFPRVCKHQAFKAATEQLPWQHDEALFEVWCTGRTGFPIVDAGMRQLVQTGWMHNRLRMVVAMFLSKDLFIDWRWGERFFMQHLVDGDLASNNGGWQWSASTGTDAAPYFRMFNPYSQSRKIDPDGKFIKQFVPELAKIDGIDLHEPQPLLLSNVDYPLPIIDRTESRARVMEAFKALGKSK